ncbi:MAG: hypothetical protein KAW39_06815 [Thermoplasmata archaeon]|nr:hypothetical protein [Thermoplasmata archaeon]
MNELGIKNHMDFNEDNINKLLGMISDEVEEDMFFGDTTSANCPKCDNDKATFKRLSIWADEPDLIIYRCTKCGFSWRSGGVSGV